MKFKDFLVACDNDEIFHVYHGAKLVMKGLCGDFIVADKKYQNYIVNRFFSYDNHDGEGSFIEVHLIRGE